VAELASNYEMLEKIEDDMEQWGGSDIFRREDRFFGSLQGSQYQRNKDRQKNKISVTHNRRMRIMGSSAYSAAYESLAAKSIKSLEESIMIACKTVSTLHCRRALLAIITRSIHEKYTKREEDGSMDIPKIVSSLILSATTSSSAVLAVSSTTSSTSSTNNAVATKEPVLEECDFEPAKSLVAALRMLKESKQEPHSPSDTAQKLCVFLRLVAFRGEPYSYTGLENLAIDSITQIGLRISKISPSIDQILIPLVQSLFSRRLEPEANFAAFSQAFLQFVISSVAQNICLACSPNQIDNSWSDSFYEDDLDDTCISQANLHYAQWASKILLQLNNPGVTYTVFRMWSLGTRGGSMSLKQIAFSQLSSILSALSANTISADPSSGALLASCIKMLPSERLSLMGSKRLWYEMEDDPAYSRYLQALLHLLSEIEVSAELLKGLSFEAASYTQGATISETSEASAPILESSTTRTVLRFDSSRSHVLLGSQKDLQGSWTVEFWIRREAPEVDEGAIEQAEKENPLGENSPKRNHAFSALASSASVRASPRIPAPFNFERQENLASNLAEADVLDFGISESVGGGRSGGGPESSGAGQSTDSSKLFSFGAAFGSRPSPFSSGFLAASVPKFAPKAEKSEGEDSSTAKKEGDIAEGEVKVKAASNQPPKREIVLPSYLLSSPNGHIKIQTGGKLFDITSEQDPLQESDPVNQRALCVSVGQRGCVDKSFDYIVPMGRWVHLAIACKQSTRSTGSISLYVDGELRDTVTNQFVGENSGSREGRGGFSLPVGVIGSSKRSQSYCGDFAEMRVWSMARTSAEIKRDMILDVSGAKGLVSHLRCREGTGIRTFDAAGMINTCKLSEVNWCTTEGPLMVKQSVPAFMLCESEEVEGLFGESIGQSVGVVEMTGVLKRDAILAAQGDMASPSSEVVCLCYRPKSAAVAPADGSVEEIEGYLDWCERGVRSILSGTINPSTGAVRLRISQKECSNDNESTILGPPESMSWLRDLIFEGKIVEGRISGNFTLAAMAPCPPPVTPGQTRIDKFTVPAVCQHKVGVRGPAGLAEVLLVKEDTIEGQYSATIEICSYRGGSSDGIGLFSRTTSSSSGAKIPQDTLEIDAEERVLASPQRDVDIAESKTAPPALGGGGGGSDGSDKREAMLVATSPRILKREASSEPTYGICANEGSIWVEWKIDSSLSGSLSFGACTSDALTHCDSSVHANDDTWCYSINGMASHGADLCECETAEDNDTIGLQLDMDRGVISFYRNDVLILEYNDINSHPTVTDTLPMQGLPLANANRGIRPFMSLVSGGDCISYKGLKDGPVEIQFPDTDPLGRSKFKGTLMYGCYNGRGVMYYHDKSKGYWFGEWKKGLQSGVHLHIAPVSAEAASTIATVAPDASLSPPASTSSPSPSLSAALTVTTAVSETVVSAKLYTRGVEVRDLGIDSPEAVAEAVNWKAFFNPVSAAASSTPSSPPAAGGGGGGENSFSAGLKRSSKRTSEKKTSSSRDAPPITFKLRDQRRVSEGGPQDMHFKMQTNVKIQRVFDVFCGKKGESIGDMRFLFMARLLTENVHRNPWK